MIKYTALILAATVLLSFEAQAAKTKVKEIIPPNDAQIAQIVLVADSADVKYGKLAIEKTSNEKVKAFAETMVRDHSAVNKQAKALAKKLGVTPEDSEISKGLKKEGKKTYKALEALEGTEFDKAYVDNEVAYHDAVIKVLDTVLLAHVENAELKALLEAGKPIFVSHLEHAKALQKELNP